MEQRIGDQGLDGIALAADCGKWVEERLADMPRIFLALRIVAGALVLDLVARAGQGTVQAPAGDEMGRVGNGAAVARTQS